MNEPRAPSEYMKTASLLAFSQTALGCGIGLLLAGRLGRTPQRILGTAALALGAAATVPVLVEIFLQRLNHPHSERRMRRRLESIRDESGLADEAGLF